jgi:hypothetical protein
MKIQTVACAIVAIALVVPAFAQTASEPSTELSRAVIQAERKDIVEAVVQPSPQQAEAFWQTYWEYRGQMSKLGDERVTMIEVFSEAGASLTDQQAEEMIEKALDVEKQAAEIKAKYSKKMRDILVPKQVVRWMQIENKMDAVINYEIARAIPLDR